MQAIPETEIIILSYPAPQAVCPDDVKQGHIGLHVTATAFLAPGEASSFPEGAYMVPVKSVGEALAKHDVRAHQWHTENWGPPQLAAERMGKTIMLPIPVECCKVARTAN